MHLEHVTSGEQEAKGLFVEQKAASDPDLPPSKGPGPEPPAPPPVPVEPVDPLVDDVGPVVSAPPQSGGASHGVPQKKAIPGA